MNSVFMENMPGLRSNISFGKAVKSSYLDGLKPYKMKGSFTEAAAYALNEANMSWNQSMIIEAANEIKAIKEGFVDSTKEKLRKIRDNIVAWAKKMWKAFVTVFTKAVAYAKTIFTSGKRLFTKELENIRLGQKYYSEGKYKTKTKLYALSSSNKLESFYSKIDELIKNLSEYNKADDIEKKKEAFAKITDKPANNEVPFYIVSHLYNETVKDAYEEKEELNKETTKTFTLPYLEGIINFKNDMDKSYKQIKKTIDNGLKEIDSAYNDLDTDDRDGDQGKAHQNAMFMLKAFMRGVNSSHIGILTVFKKAGVSGTKVIRLYVRAGMMGPDGQKKKK